jgi:hypothetical protein
MKMKNLFKYGGVIAFITAGLLVGCGGGSSGDSTVDSTVDSTSITVDTSALVPLSETPVLAVVNITSTSLNADAIDVSVADDAGLFTANTPIKRNVSSKGTDTENSTEIDYEVTEGVAVTNSREAVNSHNVITTMLPVVAAKNASGALTENNEGVVGGKVHPVLISYNEQVKGTYEMGDGSADIGDPSHVDGVFVSISLDNGATWKKYEITNTLNRQTGDIKSSIDVTWNGETIAYPAHAQKTKMAVYGNNIAVAWHDKYCPSRDPLGLNDTAKDYFLVNGAQGIADYEGVVAPNGKTVYEVPFSCVWTSRGILNTADNVPVNGALEGEVTWYSPMQLTTGLRDSNHIWIEGSSSGFAISWQEDTKGLKAGKGAGPGEGWSGATTNHGSDIWYSSIKMADFDDQDGITDTKPKSLYNFNYPVRITDNEMCTTSDKKLYCQYLCDTYGYVTMTSGNNKETSIQRCATPYTDMLSNTQVILDGDTGASRVALKILKTANNEDVVILGYEETKGLSESSSNDKDQGTSDTNIEVEGKSVYFESFLFNALDSFDPTNESSITSVAMPLVSAGKIVNEKVPDQKDPTKMIYENARRLVIGSQVDTSNVGSDGRTFVFLYKQSFDTQGASSDMFVKANYGFTYDKFGPIAGRVVTNVSAQNIQEDVTAASYAVNWSVDNLDDNTYENANENTFSPRIFLRGNNIYVGYAYTPDDAKTVQENMPSNFHIHRYLDGAWQGPQNITQVTKGTETTVDARFFTTAQGRFGTTGLASDKSNPNVLFLSWGNIDKGTIDGEDVRTEADIFFKRSTDNGATWEDVLNLATRETVVIEEKEVESYASPDGKSFYNAWLQEEEAYDSTDKFSGLDSWFGRVDYDVAK